MIHCIPFCKAVYMYTDIYLPNKLLWEILKIALLILIMTLDKVWKLKTKILGDSKVAVAELS